MRAKPFPATAKTEQKVSYQRFNSMDELFKNYRVGIVSTYVYPRVISDAIKIYPANVDGSPNEIALLKKLSIRRLQAAITDPIVMMYLAEKESIYNIEPARQIMKKELVIAFRDGEDNKKRIIILKKLLKDL